MAPQFLRRQIVMHRHSDIWSTIPAESKFLLVHVPKTGGTTLAEALYGRSINHYPVWVWQDSNPVRFANLITIAVMRDPCERLVSSVRHCLDSPRASIQDLKAGTELRRAGSTVVDMCFAYLTNRRLRQRLRRIVVFRPQAYWLCRNGRYAIDVLFSLRRSSNQSGSSRRESDWSNVNAAAPSAGPIPAELKSLADDFYRSDRHLLENAVDYWIDDVREVMPLLESRQCEQAVS
jgi:hypothetical protein